jgi:hypothetical protein
MSDVEDRIAIADTLQRYATCIDALDFSGLGDVLWSTAATRR